MFFRCLVVVFLQQRHHLRRRRVVGAAHHTVCQHDHQGVGMVSGREQHAQSLREQRQWHRLRLYTICDIVWDHLFFFFLSFFPPFFLDFAAPHAPYHRPYLCQCFLDAFVVLIGACNDVTTSRRLSRPYAQAGVAMEKDLGGQQRHRSQRALRPRHAGRVRQRGRRRHWVDAL